MSKNKTSDREKYLLRTYGISLLQYNELLRRQNNGCAICGKTPEQEGRNLAVEHNHHSGEIRGLACSYCNRRLIGRHRDPDLLRRLADYVSQGTGWFVPKKPRKRKRKKNVRRNRN